MASSPCYGLLKRLSKKRLNAISHRIQAFFYCPKLDFFGMLRRSFFNPLFTFTSTMAEITSTLTSTSTENTSTESTTEAVAKTVYEQFHSFIGKSFGTISISLFGKWLSGTLRAVEPESITVEFIVRSEMLNPARTLHGGVIAGMMDDVIGATIFMLGRKNFFTSINLVVDYFAPAKEGWTVHAVSRLVKVGSTIINAECEVWSVAEDGSRKKMLARGTSNLIKIDTLV
jgi:acyl-coenzyme A thioesterase 13